MLDGEKDTTVERRSRIGGAKRSVAIVFVIAMLITLDVTVRFSPAQTPMKLARWRQFSYAKETKQVGGQMAVLDASQRSGVLVVGQGEFARLSSWLVHTDSPDGRQYYQGFVMYDFEDDSSILAKVDATGEADSNLTGSIIFVGGQGRFAGITGRGTITSWVPTAWDMYTEIDASYAVGER